MERTIYLGFLVWLMFLNGCFLFEVDAVAGGLKVKAKLKIIHRHSRELGENTGTTLGTPANSKERIKQFVHSDHARLRVISQRLGRKVNRTDSLAKLNLVELPMRSAADLGNGQYFVSVRIGTPAKKFFLVVDTGSVLTWIRCKDESSHGKGVLLPTEKRTFCTKESRTYKPIPCGQFCIEDLFAFNTTCTPKTPCQFEHDYLDGTVTEGYIGNDTVKIRLNNGTKIKLENITFGCSRSLTCAENDYSRTSFQQVDGVLGLGFEFQAFAVRASANFGYKFSYCLVDHLSPTNLVNFLVLGGVGDAGTQVPNMQHTQLVLGVLGSFYGLNVSGISVDGKMLDIPPDVLRIDPATSTGGMMLDSGSTLTMLVEPMYDKVVSAFLPFVSQFKKIHDFAGMEHCFVNQGFDPNLVPKFAIHFADGAKFEPPVKSYIIDVAMPDTQDNVLCLGFRPIPWPDVSIIGNILQQNHLWEFDLEHYKLSFFPSSCTFE